MNQQRSRPDLRKISRQSALGHWRAAGAVYCCRRPGEESVTRLWRGRGQFVRIPCSTGREATGIDFVEEALTRWFGEPRSRERCEQIGQFRRAKRCAFAIGWTA